MASPTIARTAAEISTLLVAAEQGNKLLTVNDQGHVTYAGRKTQILHSLKSAFGNRASSNERIRENHALIAGVLQNKIEQEFGGADAPSQKRFELINNTLISIIKPNEKSNPNWRLPSQRLAQFFTRDISEIDQVATEIGHLQDKQLLKEEAIQIANQFASRPLSLRLLGLYDGTKSLFERNNILKRYERILFAALRNEGATVPGSPEEQKNLINNLNIVAQAINRILNDHDPAIEGKVTAAYANLTASKKELANLDEEIQALEKRITKEFDISGLPKSYQLQGTYLKQNIAILTRRLEEAQTQSKSNLGAEVIAIEKALVAAEEKYKTWKDKQALVDELQALRNVREGSSKDVELAQKELSKAQEAFISYFAKARPIAAEPKYETAFAIALQKDIPFAQALSLVGEREALQEQAKAYVPNGISLPLVDGERSEITHVYSPEDLRFLADGVAKTQATASNYGRTGLSIQFEKDAERLNIYRFKDSNSGVVQTETLEGTAQNLFDFFGGDRVKAATLSSVIHQGGFASILELDYRLLGSQSGEPILPQIGEIKDQPIYDIERVGNGQIKLTYSMYGVNKGFASSAGRIAINPEFVGTANVEAGEFNVASPERSTYKATFEVLIDEQKLSEGEVVAQAGASGRRSISVSADWDNLLT